MSVRKPALRWVFLVLLAGSACSRSNPQGFQVPPERCFDDFVRLQSLDGFEAQMDSPSMNAGAVLGLWMTEVCPQLSNRELDCLHETSSVDTASRCGDGVTLLRAWVHVAAPLRLAVAPLFARHSNDPFAFDALDDDMRLNKVQVRPADELDAGDQGSPTVQQ